MPYYYDYLNTYLDLRCSDFNFFMIISCVYVNETIMSISHILLLYLRPKSDDFQFINVSWSSEAMSSSKQNIIKL